MKQLSHFPIILIYILTISVGKWKSLRKPHLMNCQ